MYVALRNGGEVSTTLLGLSSMAAQGCADTDPREACHIRLAPKPYAAARVPPRPEACPRRCQKPATVRAFAAIVCPRTRGSMLATILTYTSNACTALLTECALWYTADRPAPAAGDSRVPRRRRGRIRPAALPTLDAPALCSRACTHVVCSVCGVYVRILPPAPQHARKASSAY